MSDDGQESATSTNADVMGEVLQGSDVASLEAATRQYSVGEASMIVQVGDNHASADGFRTSPSLTDTQRPGYSDLGDTETPNVKPDALDSKASPLKPAPGLATIPNSGLGHAKQDLNNKLDDAAPDHTSQDGLPSAQRDSSTAATSGAREASSVGVSQDTPSSAAGQPDTSNNQKQIGSAEKANAANGATDIDGVSVKELIQRRTSDLGGSPIESNSQTPPARRKTDVDLPEGIRVLKDRFSGASPSSSSTSPQPIPLPKEAAPKSVPVVHLEVEHKPGSKFWPYNELKDLRIENGIDPTCKEEYLTEEDFSAVFNKWDLNRTQFKAQPVWRQRMQKQTVGLF
ncbi:TPA: hypothetical protein ACH3X2_003907 [Trebouxia sp. C0005]